MGGIVRELAVQIASLPIPIFGFQLPIEPFPKPYGWAALNSHQSTYCIQAMTCCVLDAFRLKRRHLQIFCISRIYDDTASDPNSVGC